MRLPGLIAADVGPVCGSAHCRVLIGQRARMSGVAFRNLVQMRARQRREQQARELVIAQRLEAKRESEARENQAAWETVTRRSSAYPASQYERVVLPSGPRRLSNLPQRRRNRYRDHLNRIIAEAATRPAGSGAQPVPPPSKPSPLQASAVSLIEKLCTLCAGGCCTRGGHAAYLTAETIRRFMSQQPHLRPRDVLAAYLDRVAHRTETASCVNHAANGCTLPREMRSDTCNDFYCDALSGWTKGEGDAAAQGALAIVRRQDAWKGKELVEGNGIVAVAVVTERGVTPVGAF